MADIELVIKIPEEYFKALKKTEEIVSGQRSGKTFMSVIYEAVANGIPLPENHGDLKDVDALKAHAQTMTEWHRDVIGYMKVRYVTEETIDHADTIIPATKGDANENN